WYVDDWITMVYQKVGGDLGSQSRSTIVPGWEVVHHLTPSRYRVDYQSKKLLQMEIEKGKQKIRAAIQKYGR
ncbi:hypothetical protein, partial [Flagellimonas marinaquae]